MWHQAPIIMVTSIDIIGLWLDAKDKCKGDFTKTIDFKDPTSNRNLGSVTLASIQAILDRTDEDPRNS